MENRITAEGKMDLVKMTGPALRKSKPRKAPNTWRSKISTEWVIGGRGDTEKGAADCCNDREKSLLGSV